MKNQILILALTLLSVVSCKNDKEIPEAAKKELKNVVQELPETLDDAKEINDKLDAQDLSGFFEVTTNGNTIKKTAFNTDKCRVNFLKNKAEYKIFFDDKKQEYVYIFIVADDLYNLSDKTFMASKYPVLKDGKMDMELEQKRASKNIQVIYKNENTGENYSSLNGTITLDVFTDKQLKFSYNDVGAIGDFRKNNHKPMQINVDLTYNFLNFDYRK
ncbi:hypothetical protein [Lutibacter sp.]